MKSRILITVLVLALLIGGLFLPVQSGLRDQAEPEINPITAFTDVQAKEKEAENTPEDTDESELIPSDIISGLTEAEQSAYAWAAVHSDPEILLMTPKQIRTYDAALLEISQEVDILEGSKIKAKKIRSMIEKDLEAFFALDGVSLNESEQKFLAANANITGYYQDMRYGIVTDTVSLHRIPSDGVIRNQQGEDLVQSVSLACPCPVWVLHTSTDGSWYYVQTAQERGWVPADAVGITKSKEAWRSYAAPEKVVVVTDPQVTLEDTNLAMGSILSCLEENGDSYTVLLPIRKDKGTLDAAEVIIDRENCNLDYPDYTWVHLFKYLYRFMEQPQPLSNEAMICQVYSVFNIHLPQDLTGNFDALGEVTDLSEMLENDANKALAGASGPALILDADGLSVLLGARDGRIWKFQYIDGEIVESPVNEPQKFVVIGG